MSEGTTVEIIDETRTKAEQQLRDAREDMQELATAAQSIADERKRVAEEANQRIEALTAEFAKVNTTMHQVSGKIAGLESLLGIEAEGGAEQNGVHP